MVKTRFAPSPTGLLHLGNARTAIFSYLFARHHKGKFVLRIEDTDRERSRKEYEKALIEDLEWLRLEWDEFYRQSERFPLYREFAERLLSEGYAYACFCTPEELERERKEAQAKGIAYRYSGKCRYLTKVQIEKLKTEGRTFTLRFKVPEGQSVVFEDLVKGYISINPEDFGDFVIIRSDGTPTYNFVVVVDDALMGITHVIRGEDHIPNTPKQILIYKALNFPVPKFAHLPVILGRDRSKLSKRHGGVSVRYYRERGFLPEALFNYLCLLGWSPPNTEREIFSKEELIEIFDLKDVNSAPAVFDVDKLRWINGVYIREILSVDKLVNYAYPFLKSAGYKVEENYLKLVLERTRDSYDTLEDMVKRLKPFFEEEVEISQEMLSKLKQMRSKEIIELFLKKLSVFKPDSPETVKDLARKVTKELGVKPKEVWHTLRIALTGRLEGIGVDILLSTLPRERVENRLKYILSLLG